MVTLLAMRGDYYKLQPLWILVRLDSQLWHSELSNTVLPAKAMVIN